MNNDVTTLQSIAKTLSEEPMASQRVLAENAGISIGLMNAILKRFVERGWIMLSNVNMRKISYAITPEGIAELTTRSQNFVKRTFALANQYNQTLCNAISNAKNQGKKKVILYGQSNIKFLLEYACQTYDISFEQIKQITGSNEPNVNALCLIGEMTNETECKQLISQGYISLLKFVED